MSDRPIEAVTNAGNKKSISRYTLWFLILACLILLLLMQLLLGKDVFGHSVYNSYTLQAMQWRNGRIPLEENVSYLELAVYNGEYYVSFPPVPVVPVFLLTFLFGENVPDTLLIELYAVAACALAYVVLKRKYRAPVLSAVWAFLFCFASSALPIVMDGAVWYQAQMLAFLLAVAAIERTQKGAFTAGLVFFALSVGCRPFHVLFGPLLLYYGYQEHLRGLPKREIVARLLPGFLFGLSIAAAMMWYNYIRFGSVLEFGHNYLPEFMVDGRTQFALRYLIDHIPVLIFGLPLAQTPTGLALKTFGFSFLLASPIFICFLLWLVRDVWKRRFTWFLGAICAAFTVHALLLLAQRTGGGFQYGARYFVDCLPYVLLYLVTQKNTAQTPAQIGLTRVPWAEYALLGLGLMHNIVGTYFINL